MFTGGGGGGGGVGGGGGEVSQRGGDAGTGLISMCLRGGGGGGGEVSQRGGVAGTDLISIICLCVKVTKVCTRQAEMQEHI